MPRYPGRTLLYVILAVGAFLGLRGVLYRPESESGSRVSPGGRTYTQRPATFSPRLTQEEERSITCPPVAQVFDLTRKSTDGAQCVPLKITPYKADICIHTDKEDVYVSGNLRVNGVWERGTLNLFQRILKLDPGLGVIDIGANLGQYSLTAAAMGRQVISAEPLDDNIQHFHKSIKINKFEDRISLVTNAVSNKRERVYFKLYSDNKGGTSMWEGKKECTKNNNCPYACSILMDDLLPLFTHKNITKAIMKMDIEGAEHLAFASASGVLSTIHIPIIIMEIAIQRKFCDESEPDSEDKRLTQKMFAMFRHHGYTRVYDLSGMQLEPKKCSSKWPRDVVWVWKTQKFPL